MSDYTPTQSDAAFTAWLRSLEPAAVALDRAAHMTPAEIRMVAHTTATP